jgi:two-component system sensor histidine kinase KdpD
MFFSSSMTSERKVGVFSGAVMGGAASSLSRNRWPRRSAVRALAFCEEFVRRPGWILYLEAAGIVALAGALSGVFFGRSQLADVVMLFLLGIVIVSLTLGHGPSLFAAVLTVLVYDFFFIPPFYSFAVSDLRHVVTFAVMLLVAAVISSLMRRVRDQAEAAREREHRTEVLYHLSRDLARAQSVQAILSAAAEHVAHVFESRMVVLIPQPGDNLGPIYTSAGLEANIRAELGVAYAAWRSHRHAGLLTPIFSESSGHYLPLIASRGSVGVMGLFPDDRQRFDQPDQRFFLDTFASQMAAAMERAELAAEAEHQRIQVDTERLRNALLSSVSHDLRTPLAVIAGAASTLLKEAEALPKQERQSLLESIFDEGDRLNRLIGNLLDMTKLESGTVQVKREWYPVEEIFGVALNRTEARLKGRPVRVVAPPDLLAPVDGTLVEQALVNLLENVAKYTRADSPIDLMASARDRELVIEVADRGPGIALGDEDRIFEKFYRGQHDGNPSGAGLGLAIARAIAVAHGGRLVAKNRDGGGAVFTLTLPIEGEPPAPVVVDSDGASTSAVERA